KRRNACIRPEFSSGDKAVGNLANVFLAEKSDRNGRNEINNDNEPVNGGEVHSLLPAGLCLNQVSYTSSSAASVCSALREGMMVWTGTRLAFRCYPSLRKPLPHLLKCSSTLS